MTETDAQQTLRARDGGAERGVGVGRLNHSRNVPESALVALQSLKPHDRSGDQRAVTGIARHPPYCQPAVGLLSIGA